MNVRLLSQFHFVRRYLGIQTKIATNACMYSTCIIECRCVPTTTLLGISNHVVGIRNYAKSKNKQKEKGKTKVHINENELADVINVDSLKTHFQHSVETLKDEFIKNVSLRSAAGSIESIPVTLDGTKHTLQELAQIVRKNPKTIVVNMAVFPQAIPEAVKAIAKSGMNLSPQQEGTTLYIPIPKVTKEHRENLSKNAKALFVKCKTNIRDAQQKQLKSMKKKDGVSEDVVRNVEQQLIALADNYIKEAEKILEAKQNELIGKD